MQVQIGWRVIHQVPVILGVVATVVRPLPQAQGAMDVLRRGKVSVVPHDGDIWPDEGLSEGVVCPMNPAITRSWL